MRALMIAKYILRISEENRELNIYFFRKSFMDFYAYIV